MWESSKLEKFEGKRNIANNFSTFQHRYQIQCLLDENSYYLNTNLPGLLGLVNSKPFENVKSIAFSHLLQKCFAVSSSI